MKVLFILLICVFSISAAKYRRFPITLTYKYRGKLYQDVKCQIVIAAKNKARIIPAKLPAGKKSIVVEILEKDRQRVQYAIDDDKIRKAAFEKMQNERAEERARIDPRWIKVPANFKKFDIEETPGLTGHSWPIKLFDDYWASFGECNKNERSKVVLCYNVEITKKEIKNGREVYRVISSMNIPRSYVSSSVLSKVKKKGIGSRSFA